MTLPQRIKIAEQLVRRLEWQDMDLAALRRFVETARAETEPPAGSRPVGAQRHRTVDLVAAGDSLFCGCELVSLVACTFQLRNGSRAWIADGTAVCGGTTIATFAGPQEPVRAAVGIARTMIRRLSGIAAHARLHSDALGGGRTRLLDSGDFTPGWRMLEKYALALGGAWDGGIESARSRIESAGRSLADLELEIRRTREAAPEAPVELVVTDPGQVADVASTSADLIRLEGFPTPAIRDAVACVNGRAFVEAHGGIDVSNIGMHAGLGLDFVSVDGLVSNAGWMPVDPVWRD